MKSCDLNNQIGINDTLVMMRTRVFRNIIDKYMLVSMQEINIPSTFFTKAWVIHLNGIFSPGIEYFYIEFSNGRKISEKGSVVLDGVGGYDRERFYC